MKSAEARENDQHWRRYGSHVITMDKVDLINGIVLVHVVIVVHHNDSLFIVFILSFAFSAEGELTFW